MQYQVRDWMIALLVFIDPDSTVSDALVLMRKRYIHSVLVQKTPENPEYGILTSTDISDKIIAMERNPSETRVRDIMTTPVITAKQDWTLKECSLLMREHNIHHLPVSDEQGELVGMISAADFIVAAEAMGRDVVV
ncbi:MAG: CBS domain-containing protein [Anaerolineaceae bacterium]|nr:CBS domain-containing protein [Anaerolineaceae bacterium]